MIRAARRARVRIAWRLVALAVLAGISIPGLGVAGDMGWVFYSKPRTPPGHSAVDFPSHSPSKQPALVPGRSIRDRLGSGGVGPVMVNVPNGCFGMGSPMSEGGRSDDERAHRVCVGAFAIEKYEVTVGQFREFVESAGYRTDAEKDIGERGCDTWSPADGGWSWRPGSSWRNPGWRQGAREPVVCVSWNDAQAYVRWLSDETGEAYTLPTEAQWEYTARAGTRTSRYWGNNPDRACSYGNVADETVGPNYMTFNDKYEHKCDDGAWFAKTVGTYLPNALGLYDMLGNVWEWTCSGYDQDYAGAETHCGRGDGPRVNRGGSWNNGPRDVRAADRSSNASSYRASILGFRVARPPS